MKLWVKLSIIIFSLGLVVTLSDIIFIYRFSENFFKQSIIQEMKFKANGIEFILSTVNDLDYESFRKYSSISNVRTTLIKDDGKVIFESGFQENELVKMDNHLNRPEIQKAILYDSAIAERYSKTLNCNMLYFVKKIVLNINQNSKFAGALFIRVGIPTDIFKGKIIWLQSRIIYFGISLVLIMIVVTIIAAKNFTDPITHILHVIEKIKSGNLHYRIDIQSKNEIGRLAESLNGMIEKLNHDIIRLEKLELIRKQFLGNVSHELKTPIFALQTAIETLLNGAVDDKTVNRKFLEKALNNTQRLDRLLSDLIDISRIESGEMKMDFKTFHLNNFIINIVNEFNEEALKSGVEIKFIPDNNEISVIGDTERLKQVIVNLLSNALKYTPEGGKIIVYTEVKDDKAFIFVKDTGCGIPAQHLDRIFERFYRVDEDRSRKVGGTGLGLAIVKHIVEAHGSNVKVESEVNKGSTFSFWLKIANS